MSNAVTLTITLTADQARDFTRLARVAGVELDDWIRQCAQKYAADAIDALQADERRHRHDVKAEGAAAAARVRERRGGTKP